MHTKIEIIDIPKSFPHKWDLADPMPEGFSIKSLINTYKKQLSLRDVIISTQNLVEMNIPPREYLIQDIIAYPSINMLYAKRGLGKSWASLAIATSIVSGNNFLNYQTIRKGKCLIIDGEMVLADLKDRISSLKDAIQDNIDIMASDQLYQSDIQLNLQIPEDQQRLLGAIEEQGKIKGKYDLLIFDNLSSLCFGVDENDNTEQEKFFQFLIKLRHLGYAVLVIHHAGKGGDQRGASRKEDIMDTVIKLEEPTPQENRIKHNGAHFILKFTKTRGRTPQPPELDVRLIQGEDGKLEFAFSEVTASTGRTEEILRAIYEHKPNTLNDLAVIMGCGKSNISQLLKPLRNGGLVDGKSLLLTDAGIKRVKLLFPDLEFDMPSESLPF